MVKVATFFAMSFGAFLFWETMDKVHVWIALHQDEKVFLPRPCVCVYVRYSIFCLIILMGSWFYEYWWVNLFSREEIIDFVVFVM